jgi:hypothetical protein
MLYSFSKEQFHLWLSLCLHTYIGQRYQPLTSLNFLPFQQQNVKISCKRAETVRCLYMYILNGSTIIRQTKIYRTKKRRTKIYQKTKKNRQYIEQKNAKSRYIKKKKNLTQPNLTGIFSVYLRSVYLRSVYLRSVYLRSVYLRSVYLRSRFKISVYLRSANLRSIYLCSIFHHDTYYILCNLSW